MENQRLVSVLIVWMLGSLETHLDWLSHPRAISWCVGEEEALCTASTITSTAVSCTPVTKTLLSTNHGTCVLTAKETSSWQTRRGCHCLHSVWTTQLCGNLMDNLSTMLNHCTYCKCVHRFDSIVLCSIVSWLFTQFLNWTSLFCMIIISVNYCFLIE